MESVYEVVAVEGQQTLRIDWRNNLAAFAAEVQPTTGPRYQIIRLRGDVMRCHMAFRNDDGTWGTLFMMDESAWTCDNTLEAFEAMVHRFVQAV